MGGSSPQPNDFKSSRPKKKVILDEKQRYTLRKIKNQLLDIMMCCEVNPQTQKVRFRQTRLRILDLCDRIEKEINTEKNKEFKNRLNNTLIENLNLLRLNLGLQSPSQQRLQSISNLLWQLFNNHFGEKELPREDKKLLLILRNHLKMIKTLIFQFIDYTYYQEAGYGKWYKAEILKRVNDMRERLWKKRIPIHLWIETTIQFKSYLETFGIGKDIAIFYNRLWKMAEDIEKYLLEKGNV